ncbi:MAG: hypothetical protein U5K37_05520 [Natrialbaceae archaeon]|nr:hypothetical protein [Natrialbaceae archaeon]
MLADHLLSIGFIAILCISLVIVYRLETPEPGWIARLRSRFVRGVPWGTLIVVGVVLGFYLLGQDGVSNFDDPVSIPFRAWSYYYPLGLLTSSFAHINGGHITGNLLGTIVIAPIVEYAWGHYPDTEDDRFFSRPAIRACLVFPLAVFVTGVVLALIGIGPVIGFSVPSLRFRRIRDCPIPNCDSDCHNRWSGRPLYCLSST